MQWAAVRRACFEMKNAEQSFAAFPLDSSICTTEVPYDWVILPPIHGWACGKGSKEAKIGIAREKKRNKGKYILM